MGKTPHTPEKLILAYSGGLDTSVAIRWLALTLPSPPRERARVRVQAMERRIEYLGGYKHKGQSEVARWT